MFTKAKDLLIAQLLECTNTENMLIYAGFVSFRIGNHEQAMAKTTREAKKFIEGNLICITIQSVVLFRKRKWKMF
jgi:hypothetical protein